MKGFETMEKELREKRGVISAFDFAKEAVAIATVAIDVAAVTSNGELAGAIAAMKMEEAMNELFHEEPQEEKNTEKDAKPVDLKQMLFNHTAGYRVPIPGTVESNCTAEIERHAKHAALLSLIFNAGLTAEYRKWLMENGYE